MNSESVASSFQYYQIFIKGLKVAIRLGCSPEERLNAQSVSIDLVFDLSTDPRISGLEQTVCYLTASQIVSKHAAQSEWVYIEDFLCSLSAALFKKFPACMQIESRLTKFVVPVCEGAGVRIVFKRESK